MSRRCDEMDKAKLIREAMSSTRASCSNPLLQISGIDCDEVYPNVYISDESTAISKKYLLSIGITHVLNAAQGKNFGMVNTSALYYNDTPIKYKGLSLVDLPVSDASRYFYEAADFIDDALKANGKVLVHCVMGMSRSATMVLAFLMLKRGMSACEAMITVRRERNIRPNDGFIEQLALLDNKLHRRKLLWD